MICGLSGGVDSAVAAALVHKAVGDQLTCVFVDTGLLRAGEAEQVEPTRSASSSTSTWSTSRRPTGSSSALDDVHRPGAQAQDDRRDVHTGVRGGGGRPGRRPLPRPGDALSRHHRVGHQGRGQDQVPPQRRRPARRHAVRAGRAAAQPVQGRGAGRRRGARPARGDRVAPALPRAGPGRAHHRHDHRRSGSPSSRRPTPSSPRRSAGPASTGSCGRASRCCRSCAPSA